MFQLSGFYCRVPGCAALGEKIPCLAGFYNLGVSENEGTLFKGP